MRLLIFLILILFQLEAAEPVIAAYYDKHFSDMAETRFNLSKIPPALLTDLYFAYVSIEEISRYNPSLKLIATESDKKIFTKFEELQVRLGKLNLIASIGGEEFNNPKDIDGTRTYLVFTQMASSERTRARFIDALILFAYEYGFNGINLAWEYPGDLTRGGKEEDFENYLALLKEFQDRLATTKPKLILSANFPPFVPPGIPKKYQDPKTYFQWVASCSKYLERVHLTAYGYHTPLSSTVTGVNAPLNRDTDPNSTTFIAQSIDNYIDNGVPKEKIILGIPLFGYNYNHVSDLTKESFFPGKSFKGSTFFGTSLLSTTGLVPYYEIAEQITKGSLQLGKDPLTSTAMAFSVENKNWISFDTPETVQQKAALASKKGLKGVYFWSINQDAYQASPPFPNISAVKSALYPK